MKNFFVLFAFVATTLCLVTANEMSCKLQNAIVPDKWSEMVLNCTNKVKQQIQKEVNAALTYLAMGTHFAQDKVNRPGFSEFFFKAASEERQHAIKLVEYLLMRGQLTSGFNNLIKITNELKLNTNKWDSGLDGLKSALLLETQVTDSIRDVMKECEEPSGPNKSNDYHLVDYLTTVYLEEQYHGQRDLAGKISTLGKMMQTQGPLAEFLFDKKMLNGEV